MKTTKYILTLMLTAWCALANLYAVEKSYYNSVDGKSGTTLREALTTLTYTKHTTDVGYNWTFDGIDIVNGVILDIYSYCAWSSSQQGKSYSNICDGYNREHIVPQSLFNEEQPQKSDRHHLFLADGLVNGLRSSYPFGETNVTTAFSGYSNGNKALGKLGTASSGYSGTVYEPDDEYKGDIARAVLYMAVRYATSDVCRKYGGSANSYPVTSWNNGMFSGNLSTNYGLSNNAIAVFLKWHRNDPVSAKEVARNNGVEKKQGNRNPFIDLPDLVEYLWGNHAGETVNLSSLDIATGGGSVPTTYEITLNRNGATEIVTCTGTYTLPTASMEADACDGWAFAGWTTSSSVSSTTVPTYTTSVSGATTLYAVYSHTEAASAPIKKALGKATSISAGDQVVFVCEGASTEMTAISTTSTKYGVGTAYTTTPAGTFVFDVVTGNSSGTFAFKNGSNYLYWTSGNSLNVNSTLSNNTSWSVTFDNSGNATIKNASDNARQIVWNVGSPRFATYSSPTIGNSYYAIQLYKNSSGGGSTTTYKTSPECGSSHTISLISSGTVTGGTFAANASSAYAGATITLFAEPIDGYTFGSWSVTAGGNSVTVTDNQFTMPAADVTISATFNALPTYNIKFYNNSTQIGSTQSIYAGGIPDVPVIESCEGYTFVGWWTAPLATDNTATKSWIEDFTATANKDYYAIFEHTVTSSGSGETTWEPVTSAQDDWSGEYVITNSDKTYAMTSDFRSGTSGEFKGAEVTVTNNKVVSPTDKMIWTVAKNGTNTQYSFQNKSTGTYAKITGTSSTNAALDASAQWFTIESTGTSGVWDVASVSNSARCFAYYAANTSFRTYAKNNNNTGYLFKKTGGSSSTTYYTSTTDCASACTKLDAPEVTATPGNGQITLTWADVTDADHYTVTIGKGAGYTTECGSAASIGTITHSGSTNTCVITGLTNGLTYTTNVVANASSSTCDSDADSDSATPQDCTPWDDPTLSWNKYSLNTTDNKTATVSVGTPTHGTLSFESSDTDVLSVNSSGTLTAVGAGEATVTAHWTAADGYCEKTMTSQTFVVAGPLTISFDANGGTGTMTDQTVTYNVSAAINGNAFEREGYSFVGWAISADGEKVYNDKQSVAFTNSQTLYAKWQLNSHNVSFTPSPTGATITINGQSTSPQTAEYGTTVTLHITPAEHYTITSVSIQGATSLTEITQTGSGETRTFTMPDENVIVAVSMGAESQYTATFYNNGTQYGEAQTSYADDDINAPATNPVSCDEDEFTFVGWVAAEQTSEITSMPEVLTFPQAMPVGNVSFYALYRRVEGSGGGEASVTFKTASSDGNAAYTTDSEIKTNLVESYSGIASFAGERAYSGKNGVKLGASGGVGYITLNLSSPITTNTITVNASKYGTDTGKLQVEVNGSNSFGSSLSPADGTLTFTNASEVEITDLTISTTSKRAYVASISLGGGGTSYYTTSPVCVPCDYQVTLTKGAESHGTFTLNKANGTYDNCKTNFIVTVSGITPDDGYYCSGVTATGGSHAIVAGPDGSGNYTVSYTKDNTIETTITAIFDQIPTYTVTWSSNGDTGNQDSYKEGEAIIFPPSASGCDGKVFMGWSAVEVAEQDEAPEYTTSAVMGNSDITYYAVFATAGTGGSGGELLNETFDNELSSDATTEFADNTFANFPTGNSKAYKGAGGTIKLGSGSASGHITSKSLDLSSAFTVSLAAKYYNTGGDNANINIIVDWGETSEQTKTITKDELTGSFKNFSFNFTAASSTSQVRIETSTKRAYIDNVVITSGSGTTYSGYTTSCTECLTKVTLTKGDETNGSFTLNKADGEYNNCISDFVVTVSGISPDPHYYCTGVTATGENVEVSGPDGNGNYTVTYTKGNSITSTITANFAPNPTYAVTWSMDGDENTKVYYEEGDEIEFPTSATGCEDKTFMGWTATAIDAPQDEAPTYVTSATMGTSPVTFYAVYAEEDESGSSISSGDYELVESAFSNWAGDYLIAYSDKIFADGRIGGTDAGGIGKQYVKVNPGEKLSGKVVDGLWGDEYNVTIVESDTEGKYLLKTKDGKYNYQTSNSNGLSATANKTTAEDYPLTITFNSSADIDIAIEAGAVLHYNTQGFFRFYKDGGQNNVYLYRKGGGGGINYTNYTTTCGAAISAKNIGWITAAQGQKVKRVINVSAKGFDEATTLSATSGDAQFKVTLGASNVPAGKTGLSTTLTVEYTPTVSDNRVANVEIVLSAGGITKTITVSGRSLPDEFLAITKKNDTWYALPANMTGGENQYEGVVVTPDNDSDPTMVAVAPSTIVYGLRSADNSRYAENGAYVRLAGNGGKALWGNTTANAVTIQNSETVNSANTENYEWSLNTTDGIHYTIANPHHADYASGRVLAFGDKFGLYKTATVFFLVPTGCNSQPLEVNVSARRVDATFSWISNASSVTIDLYTDEEKTAFATSATVTSVPYYMTGLEESTHYWFTLTPDGEDACAVSGEFETTGPTIDVVEWTDESVIVSVDKDDEFHPSIVIDGEVEHGAGTGRVADELFFSKYFEGSGSMKLVAIFNGTKEDIDLTNYTIFVRMRGKTGSWSGSTNDVTLDLSSLGSIASGQEIIFFSRPLGTEAALASCSNTFLDDKVTNSSSAESNPRWVECNGTTYKRINFNGNDPILLRKSGTTIDIIGSESDTAPTTKNCLTTNDNEKGWSGTVKNMDKGKSPSDPVFDAFYEASSKTPVTTQDSIDLLADFGINLTADEIGITTARCILFRDKRVVSGDSAVLMNGETFVTFTNHDTFKSEWTGRAVCMDDDMQDDAGVDNDAQATCNSYQDLSNFDYSEYYKDWTTIDEQKLDDYIKDPEAGTYEILIPNLAKYSCLNIRFQLKNDAEEVVTEAPVQVPIIVKDKHTTIDAIFNEIVKTDGGDPLYTESINRCKTCDVVVLSGGVLTKAADSETYDVPEVGNVKVYPRGKLIVPPGTSYSVNSLAFRRQEDEVSTADIQGDLDIKAAGNNVYLDLRVDPSEWHYIALPYNCNVADIRFAGDEMKIPILGTDYLLKYYDGEKRAATQAGGCWEMVAPDATLRKGIGYIFGIPGEGKVKREFRFPMSNEIITEEKDPEGKIASGVYAFGGDKSMTEVRANHRGWNLIGDPYLLPYSSDIADPVMTGYIVPDYPEDPEAQWDGHYKFADDARSDLRYIVEPVDNGRSEYIQVPITAYEMKPFTSYFVQIGGSNPEAEQGVQFHLDHVNRGTSASPVRRAPAEYAEEQEDKHPVWCAVTITSPKGETDETTMLISDQFTDGYDIMDDLVKMRGTYYQYAQITTKPVLASRNNEGEMAFNALPDASAEAGIPLHYFAATQGEYVIAYSDKYGSEEIQAVMLLDKQLNEWHDLMNEPYTFYTNRTDDKNRFVLTIRVDRRKEPQIATDTDAASSANDRPRKILHNDHIYILRGDRIYDITGKEMLNR